VRERIKTRVDRSEEISATKNVSAKRAAARSNDSSGHLEFGFGAELLIYDRSDCLEV